MLFNRARALEYMRRYEIDALVATSPANVTYFTDYYWWTDPLFKQYMMVPGAGSDLFQSYAVFPLEGEPALVLGAATAVNAADSWVKHLYLFGDKGVDTSLRGMGHGNTDRRIYDLVASPRRGATPTDELVSALNDRGLTGARIGVEFDRLPSDTAAALRHLLPDTDVKDCSNLLRLVRMVKSEEELSRLTRAAEIAEQAGMETLATARRGARIGNLIHHYKVRIAEMGADFDHFIYGMRGVGIASEAEYVIGEDDVMFVDWGVLYQHYFSDTGTTLAMSGTTGALADRHAAVVDCMDAGIATLKPGARSSEAREAMCAVLSERGVETASPRTRLGCRDPRLSHLRRGQRPANPGRLRRRALGRAVGGGHGRQPRGAHLHAGRRLAPQRADLRDHLRRLPPAGSPGAVASGGPGGLTATTHIVQETRMTANDIKPGQTGEIEARVTKELAINRMGREGADVLSTAALLSLMEQSCIEATDADLPEGHTTVGYAVDKMRHMAPTPLGATVTVKAVLTEVDGNRLTYSIEAFEGDKQIGAATHKRAIIPTG